MESIIQRDLSAEKLFVFEEVYPARAAQEQADRSKLDAFGRFVKLNPFNRPANDNVELSKWELRYEPFWHVVAQREVDYMHEATYAVSVTNPHALKITIDENDYEVTHYNGKSRIDIPLQENCHRKIETSFYLDGLKREIKSSVFHNYIQKYKAPEVNKLDRTDAVVNQVPRAAVTEIVRSRLGSEPIDAHMIDRDLITFSKVHLYYKPVFAFEYLWKTSMRSGVIEIDGLTGQVIENGEWLREKVEQVMTREMLLEIGAEFAGAIIPGGGVAVKVIGKMTE